MEIQFIVSIDHLADEVAPLVSSDVHVVDKTRVMLASWVDLLTYEHDAGIMKVPSPL